LRRRRDTTQKCCHPANDQNSSHPACESRMNEGTRWDVAAS
jgi:hypothetical protein